MKFFLDVSEVSIDLVAELLQQLVVYATAGPGDEPEHPHVGGNDRVIDAAAAARVGRFDWDSSFKLRRATWRELM